MPTITSANGTHTVVAGDFNISDGRMTWYGAMAWAEWLGRTTYGGANDWRLWSALNSDGSGPCGPDFNYINSELAHLFYTEGGLTLDDATTSSPALADVFTNLQNSVYWSGTEFAPDPAGAWHFIASSGDQDGLDKSNQYYVWAVRPGQVEPAPGRPAPVPALGPWGLGLLGLLLMVLARARLR